MAEQQGNNTGSDSNRSIDSLLNDIDASRSTSAEESGEQDLSRRKNVDRRGANPKPPMGTIERRLEEDRRAKKKSLDNAKEQIAQHKAELKLQQHRKKILLAGCEPVMGLNYDNLAMDDYPDNMIVAEARRDRDYWVAICAVFGTLFVFSLLGLVSAWVGGVGAGLAFLSAVFAFSPARKFFFSRPHLHELLSKRKVLEYSALHHIQYLEGVDGLAWRCQKLAKFNSNLENKLFFGLYKYSKEQKLLEFIQSKKTIRLYLLLMVESQKAYKRLEKEYLEAHFQHLDQGWDDRIDAAEAAKIEQSLNVEDKKLSDDAKS